MSKIEYCIGRHGTEPYWVKEQVDGRVHAVANRDEHGMLRKLVVLAGADPVIVQSLMSCLEIDESKLASLPKIGDALVLFESNR